MLHVDEYVKDQEVAHQQHEYRHNLAVVDPKSPTWFTGIILTKCRYNTFIVFIKDMDANGDNLLDMNEIEGDTSARVF